MKLKLFTATTTIAFTLFAINAYSQEDPDRENLDPNATWSEVHDAYADGGWPDWLQTGDIDTSAFVGFVVTGHISAAMDPSIIPVPWCLDIHGCVDPSAPPEVQREQNRQQWYDWCGCEPPLAYGHFDVDGEQYSYELRGTETTIRDSDGNEVPLSDLLDSLPDCWDGWQNDLGAAAGVAMIWTGLIVYFPPLAVTTIPLAIYVIGVGSFIAYCNVAEGM